MPPSRHLPEYLAQLLYDLESVEEPLPHHPEENALLHSLQAFELAHNAHANPVLIAASLLHDIGKSHSVAGHAQIGAQLLDGLMPDHVVWLVAHHMDLVYEQKRTERALRNSSALIDLKKLRQWDLQARVVDAQVCTVEFAVSTVCCSLDHAGDVV